LNPIGKPVDLTEATEYMIITAHSGVKIDTPERYSSNFSVYTKAQE